VDARRIVLQMLDGESCVSVLDPFEIYHNHRSSGYRCPPGFMELYRQNLDKVSWSCLSTNPGAVDLLAEHLDKVDGHFLRMNPHPGAVAMFLDYELNSECLSRHYGAMDVLAAHPEWINWRKLSKNTHSRAIELLAANLDKIDWGEFSGNVNPAVTGSAPRQDRLD
jgi:hypothetical protein